MDNDTPTQLWQRYEEVKAVSNQVDEAKNRLIEELLVRYLEVNEALTRLGEDVHRGDLANKLGAVQRNDGRLESVVQQLRTTNLSLEAKIQTLEENSQQLEANYGQLQARNEQLTFLLSQHPSRSISSVSASSDDPSRSRPDTPPTWASLVQKTVHLKADSPGPTIQLHSPSDSSRVSSPDQVLRNRKGQRVDSIVRDYDKEEVNRMKKLKLCNVHYLRGPCQYGDSCAHVHDYKPRGDDLALLRLVARMAPCTQGFACNDAKCIYGHRCPAPDDKRGGKPCIFGDQCRYPAEMHGVDTKIVKTTKV